MTPGIDDQANEDPRHRGAKIVRPPDPNRVNSACSINYQALDETDQADGGPRLD